MNFLKGYKTYIIGICGILYALFGFVTGHLDSQTAIQLFFGSLAAMGLRNGITTEAQNLAALLPDKTLPSASSTTTTTQ
jgi:hypothetical protein